METSARPSGPGTRNQVSPAKCRFVPFETCQNASSERANAPTIAAIATSAVFPRPYRRPRNPFRIAPPSGKRMIAQRYDSAAEAVGVGIRGGAKEYNLVQAETSTLVLTKVALSARLPRHA